MDYLISRYGGVGIGERKDIPLPASTFTLKIILVGTSVEGNAGAICRAMLNYGFDQLSFVQPLCDIYSTETRNRAKHAQRVLDEASVYDTLDEAIRDCSLVFGTSGKRETGDKTAKRHFLYPWELDQRISSFHGTIGLVFGEEGKGLSSDDLAKCDDLVTLPTWEGYPIANLSHAVSTILYELHRGRVLANLGSDPGLPEIVPLERTIPPKLRNILNQSIDELGEVLPGLDERGESFSSVLKRAVLRSQPTEDEATRLIGGLVDATTALQKVNNDERWLKDRRRRIND